MKSKDLFVRGRLCLFGEHSDWAGEYRKKDASMPMGHCLIVGTDQGIRAEAKAHRDKFIITSILPDKTVIDTEEFDMDEQSLRAVAEEGKFFSYCVGVVCYLLQNHEVGGLEIKCTDMDLPIKRGLSSSAAICVLVARAFNFIYDLKLTKKEEMEIAYQGEIMALSKCGRMDQACAFDKKPVLLTFDGDNMKVEVLKPAEPLYMVIVDLKKGKNTKKILTDLNRHYTEENSTTAQNLQKALGPLNKEVVFQAKEAIEQGDSKKIGMLMTEAQANFDKFVMPACPEELASPKLHDVLEYSAIQSLVWGGKGVGSQGDGSAQFIARGHGEQIKLIKRLQSELDVNCLKLTIPPIKEKVALNN